jgi:predicted RNA-binding protein associated with RNAse of E/G family
VLALRRPQDAYAVIVFWEGPQRDFACWYVNFAEPPRRTADGFDTQDLELDLIVWPDGRLELKDDDALDLRVHEGRFTEDQARATRAEAARLIADLEAGRRWWDDDWSRWHPS